MTYVLILCFAVACQQWLTTGYFYRRFLGGKWQKIWYNRWDQGGYTVWERYRPNFDYESVGGRIIKEEG